MCYEARLYPLPYLEDTRRGYACCSAPVVEETTDVCLVESGKNVCRWAIFGIENREEFQKAESSNGGDVLEVGSESEMRVKGYT